MTYQFPADIENLIRVAMLSGECFSVDDLFRRMLNDFNQRHKDIAAIKAGALDAKAIAETAARALQKTSHRC